LVNKKNISAYSVLDFNQCNYKTTLDFIRPPKDFKPLVDPWLEIIRKIGIEHENNYISKLNKKLKITTIDDSKSIEERKELTKKAIISGDEIIYQGFLQHERLNGIPDLLIKKEGYYQPCDIKSSFSLKTDNIIQLCHYAYLLKNQFDLMPKTGKIILRDESEQEINFSKFYDYYLHISNNLKNFIESETIIEDPVKCSLCSKCRYKLLCEGIWDKSDHLNQVSNISKSQIKTLKQNGINTLEDLSTISSLKDTGLNPDSGYFLIEQAKLQINYKKTKKLDFKIIFEEKRRIIDEHIPIGFELLPKKDVNDLFFDIEGYPMYLDPKTSESGLEYLFGVYFRIFNKPTFKKFLSVNHEEEKKSFEELVDFFYNHTEKFKNASIYHYGSYEITALKKLSEKYESKYRELDQLLRNNKFVDLYKIIKDSLLLSTSDYKLKTIEKFYNFSHDSDVSSGEDSLVAFEKYLDSNSEEILKEIIKYNKLDCESTEKLRDWIISIKPKGLKPFSPPPLKEISDRAKERIIEEKEIFNSIDQNVEIENELNSTLKGLTNYGYKELRPKWWEYFENLKKDEEELVDDSNSIGLLKFHNEDPNSREEIQTGRMRGWVKKTVTFSYPKQIVKLKIQDGIEDSNQSELSDLPDSKKVAISINEIDYLNSSITLDMFCHPEAEKANYFPTGIIPAVNYFDRVVDNAVKKFFNKYNEQNSFPAIKDFLDKKDPKYKNNINYESSESIENITERIESLNNSYLFIQGPPGTGKTYISSRVIINLLKKNYKIAILCNSHNAIINLLNSVDDYAQEINFEFNGIYRRSGHQYDKLGKNITVKNTTPFSYEIKDYNLYAGTGAFLSSTKFIEDSEVNKNYDYIFFDEAGQLSLSHVIAGSMASKNIILVGDHMQLPKPKTGKQEGNASLSPVEYIMEDKNTIADSRGIFLNKTYRMHDNISNYISENFYENRLKPDINNDKQNIIIEKNPLNGIYLIDLNHEDFSVQNEIEADYLKKIYDNLLGKFWIDKNHNRKLLTEEDILVISPFNAQVNLLKDKLYKNSRVGTVDIFQGQEAPIVLTSYSTSDPENIGFSRGSDFFFDFRRLNVSISRARSLSVILFNKELLNYNCSTIDDIERINYFCKLKAYEKDPMDFMNLIR